MGGAVTRQPVMRIIGGQWRSRKLIHPAVVATRPMPDRVKAAIFSRLGSLFETPGELPSLIVFDVFAGSGSLGLEALSRGAARCLFFERHREALSALRANISAMRAVDCCLVATGNAWTTSLPPETMEIADLLFLDPPYEDSDDDSPDGAAAQYLSKLSKTHGAERDPPVIVFHHRRRKTRGPFPPHCSRWRLVEVMEHGTHAVTVLAP